MILQKPLITRFAPSPTGYLHLGHVVSALYVWAIARAKGAKIILRIEDHDRGRCRPEYESAILEDLKWLGFVQGIGFFESEKSSIYRQSDCSEIYKNTLIELSSKYHVYGCECSRRNIADLMPEGGTELCYKGTCRKKNLSLETVGLGVRIEVPDEKISFVDGLLGSQNQVPAKQCGDILLCDKDGNWTYNFAVAVDDFRQGVNLVIRGEDLLQATGRQIMLSRMLGRSDPVLYLHHPLVKDSQGNKLSKRTLAEAIAKKRMAGENPENVLGEVCRMLGLLEIPRPITLAEAGEMLIKQLSTFSC